MLGKAHEDDVGAIFLKYQRNGDVMGHSRGHERDQIQFAAEYVPIVFSHGARSICTSATATAENACRPLAKRELRGHASAMYRLPADLKAKGDEAEASFRAWLNQSGVAFLYVEQSPLNVPDRLRGRIKRPDYLVGIPHAGMMAFDVKAKSTYDDHLLFEVGEVDKLACFEAFFHMTVI